MAYGVGSTYFIPKTLSQFSNYHFDILNDQKQSQKPLIGAILARNISM